MPSFSINPFVEGSSENQFKESLTQFKAQSLEEVLELSEKVIREHLKVWLEKSGQSLTNSKEQQAAAFIKACSELVIGELKEPFASLGAVFRKLEHQIPKYLYASQTPMQLGFMLDWRGSLSLDQSRINSISNKPIQQLFGISEDKSDLINRYKKAFSSYASAKSQADYGEALSQLNLLSGNDETNGVINFRIGLLYLYCSDLYNPQYATSFFVKAADNFLNANIDDWDTSLFEGLLEINREEYHQTLYRDDLKKWLAAEAYAQAATSCYVQEAYQDGMKYIELAIDHNEHVLEAHYLKAKLHARLQEISLAVNSLFEVIQKERLYALKALLDSDFWQKDEVKDLYIELRSHVLEEVEARLEKCYAMMIADSGITELLDNIKKEFSDNNCLLKAFAIRDDLVKKRTWTTTPVVFKPTQRVFGHALRVNSIAFTRDAKLMATASWKIIISDLGTGEEVQTLMGHSVSEYVYSVTFSHNNKLLASASSDRTIKIWDVETGEELMSLSGHKQSINSVLFNNNDTMLASASSDGTIKLWDVQKGQLIKTLQSDKNGVNTIAFSPDGKYLAAGGWAMTIMMWNVQQKKKVRTFQGHEYCVNGLAFSPDGKTLASASWDKTIKLWNVESGQEQHTLEGHHNGIESVKFSQDGQKLVSTSYNRNGKLCVVKLWDVARAREEETIAGDFYGVEFSPDGNNLALASRDRTIKLWGAPTLSVEEYIQVEKENLAQAKTDGLEAEELEPESEDERRRRHDRRKGGFWLGSGDRRTGQDRRNL
jgi:WD40 repeat protein